MRARYWNAGHLLGSASIEVEVERDGRKPLRILFSGDIGPDHKLFEPDPEAPVDFDYVICESTYGGTDRFERSQEKRRELLGAELRAAASRQGAVLIPSFAVERTQEILVDLIALMNSGSRASRADLHRFAAGPEGDRDLLASCQVAAQRRCASARACIALCEDDRKRR